MFSAGLRANGAKTERKKRMVKSPYQLMALESFYNEHKYPSVEMKTEFGEEIGLSENQVTGWFCLRRRVKKDKGNNTGGLVQDHGSGYHSQDSCGSSKQNEYENPKPREVESQRLYEESYKMENVDGADRSSFESSSSFHGHHLVPDVSYDRVITPLHPQVVTSYGYKPSGYLKVKVKGESENAGIAVVKRLLGRHYRNDGPPLAVDFDPVPPGAFESLAKDIVQEPFCFGDQRRSHSPHGVRRNLYPGSRYGAHNSENYSLDPYLEDDDDMTVGNGFGCGGNKSHQEPRLEPPPLNYYDSLHRPEGVNDKSHIKIDQISRHGSTAGDKSGYFTKPSNLMPSGGCRLLDSKERGPSSRMAEKYYGERNHLKMRREKLHSVNEPPVPIRPKQGYLHSSSRFYAERDRGSGSP